MWIVSVGRSCVCCVLLFCLYLRCVLLLWVFFVSAVASVSLDDLGVLMITIWVWLFFACYCSCLIILLC